MVSSSESTSSTLLSLTLMLMIICIASPILATDNPSSDHNNLVYKHCANQTASLSPISTLLSSLLQELVEKSSESKFYETNIGDDETAISGLFQCRGDLSYDECHNCVNKLPIISNTLCGDTVPARVQLLGCYVHYKLDGATTFRHDLLHKICGKPINGGWSESFQEIRSRALGALLGCVTGSGHGYCEMSYESMNVMGECEGNLGECECGECVKNAVQVAEDECRESVFGEVYLESCHVRYVYQPHGNSSQGGGGQGVGSAKLVAIAVGGVAALFSNGEGEIRFSHGCMGSLLPDSFSIHFYTVMNDDNKLSNNQEESPIQD